MSSSRVKENRVKSLSVCLSEGKSFQTSVCVCESSVWEVPGLPNKLKHF